MRHMKHFKSLVVIMIFLTYFSLLLGCSIGGGNPSFDDVPQGQTSHETAADAVQEDPLPPVEGDGQLEGNGNGTEEEHAVAVESPLTDPAQSGGHSMEKDEIMIASPDVQHESSGGSETAPDSSEVKLSDPAPTDPIQPEIKFNYDVIEIFDPAHPTLMGLNLQSTLEAVTARFGEPIETFMLPDETTHATVYAYPGFTVGISDGLVLFVEVSSRTINPGLNGFRVGGKTQDVAAAIGKPDANTDYVLSYKGDGVILKFDIDPQTDKIQSIKLFPEE